MYKIPTLGLPNITSPDSFKFHERVSSKRALNFFKVRTAFEWQICVSAYKMAIGM
jgi:hypothetical protein